MQLSAEQVAAIRAAYQRCDFWSLKPVYGYEVCEGSSHTISVTVGEDTKTVCVYLYRGIEDADELPDVA